MRSQFPFPLYLPAPPPPSCSLCPKVTPRRTPFPTPVASFSCWRGFLISFRRAAGWSYRLPSFISLFSSMFFVFFSRYPLQLPPRARLPVLTPYLLKSRYAFFFFLSVSAFRKQPWALQLPGSLVALLGEEAFFPPGAFRKPPPPLPIPGGAGRLLLFLAWSPKYY